MVATKVVSLLLYFLLLLITRKHKPKSKIVPENLWCQLPDLILEKIFSYLNMEEKYYASMVCSAWYRGFYLPYSWSTFIFEDSTLTRRKFNYYSGWQYILDHLRTQQCLMRVGRNIRILIFTPMTNFYNLYEFMNMLSYFAEQQGSDNLTVEGVGSNIHTLSYTFPCNMSPREEQRNRRLYGTGGKLLEALKRLMSNLGNLRHLELIDLMLDSCEALHLLDEVCYQSCDTLQSLVLINATKLPCQLLHVGIFVHLQVLVISPHTLGEDVLYLLSETTLRHLHLVQNRYTPTEIIPVNWRAWQDCVKRNPYLLVHLRVESTKEKQLLWQEGAPVHSVVYVSPQCKLQADIVSQTVDLYHRNLEVFGHLGLPKFYQPKSFNERLDPFFLLLCRQCHNLNTLIIRERISTATVLLLADTAINLRYFYVRRNAVIIRCDWPKNPEWAPEFYEWLRSTSQSYQKTEREVSLRLGKRWHMLTDKEFKQLTIKKLI